MPKVAAMTKEVALLTAPEVADRLRVTIRTLQRLEVDGELVAVRIGRSVRYRPEDVEAFIETQRNAS